MSEAPDRIWAGNAGPDLGDTWSDELVPDWIEYLRADIAERQPAEARAELAAVKLAQEANHNLAVANGNRAREEYDRAEKTEIERDHALRNMRENYEAFCAMRNDLNELFPIQSVEADLVNGPEMSVSCAVIVESAKAWRDRLAAEVARLREAVLWYEGEALGAEKAMQDGKPSPNAALAILTVLALDGGKRGRLALVSVKE